jgi:hypothetical protein
MTIRQKTNRLIALFFLVLMIHSIVAIQVFAQDGPPPAGTDPGVDVGTEDPPVGGSADDDAAVPPMTDAPGAGVAAAGSGGTGDEPGELSTVAATAPDIAGMSGAATYSIPISVQPKGHGGIVPKLQLTYNSSLRNGPLGVGWSLDLGSIQRNTKKGRGYTARDFVNRGVTPTLLTRQERGWPGQLVAQVRRTRTR